MNRHLRMTLAAIKAAGATVVSHSHSRHTEIEIEKDGKRGVIRVHRGNKVLSRAEPMLRSQIRRIIEGEP